MFNMFQGFGIDAIPQAARSRAIGEYMTEMSITGITKYFYAAGSIGIVFDIFDRIFFNRLSKTWPAGFGIVFYSGVKEFGVAANTIIFSRLIPAAELATEFSFGAFPAGNPKLLRRQNCFPFLFCFFNSPVRQWIAFVRKIQNIVPVDHDK